MKSPTAPPFALDAYAGRYDHPLFGPLFICAERSGLTLRMGDRQVADLEYHGGNAFYVRWRDLLFRENFGTHVFFEGAGASIASLRVRINRDELSAQRTLSGDR